MNPSTTPDPISILDDLADSVSGVLERRQIPFDAQGARFAVLNLLHLAATIAVDHDVTAVQRIQLNQFFQAACDKNEGLMEHLNEQLLGDQGVFVAPTT